jgi:hypothetical protein
MTYDEQLLHPKWQRRKAEILARDNHKCRSCGSEHVTLHAHHIFYIPETFLWDYKDDSLITLCEVCHNTEHLIGNTLRTYLLELIQKNPLMIHMVAQLCVLAEEVPKFEDSLRKFLKDEMNNYYQSRKSHRNGEKS